MITFLLIIATWWIIHFVHYALGQKMVTNVPEEQVIEIISSPMLFSTSYRKTKKIERWSLLLFLLLFYPITIVYLDIFRTVQELILPSEGVTVIGTGLVIPAIMVTFGSLFLLVVKLASIGRTQDKNWKLQPSLKEAQERIGFIKKWSVRCSWLTQIVFILFIFQFVNLDNQGVTHSSFLDLGTRKYEYSDFEKASLSVKMQTVRRRGVKSKEFLKHYFLYHKNGKRLELWDDIGWNTNRIEKLKKATRYLHENNVEISIDYPHFIDWAEYKRELTTENYQKIKDLFESCRLIVEDIPTLIPAGKSIHIDSLVIRLDSTTRDYGQAERGFLYTPLEGKIFQYVHLMVENNQVDSFYVNGFNLRIFDDNDSSYIHSLWLDESFESHVPPNATHTGYFIFQVPKEATGLKLQYQYGYIDKRYFWFDLSQKK